MSTAQQFEHCGTRENSEAKNVKECVDGDNIQGSLLWPRITSTRQMTASAQIVESSGDEGKYPFVKDLEEDHE